MHQLIGHRYITFHQSTTSCQIVCRTPVLRAAFVERRTSDEQQL
jgi:hypothetical protein